MHRIVTGGGLSLDGRVWLRCRPRFFLPVRKLSQVCRGKLLDKLRTAVRREPASSRWPTANLLVHQAARRRKWVVCKAPLAGPEQVLRYLDRYTHRIAIGNERLIDLSDGVRFSYRDRKRRRRGMERLPAEEFVRRFLLHALPRGLVRVRHYGLLANGIKAGRLDLCCSLLGAPGDPKPTPRGEALLGRHLRALDRLRPAVVSLLPRRSSRHRRRHPARDGSGVRRTARPAHAMRRMSARPALGEPASRPVTGERLAVHFRVTFVITPVCRAGRATSRQFQPRTPRRCSPALPQAPLGARNPLRPWVQSP